MTRSVGVHEAKTRLSRLLDEVSRGETITLTKRGRPVARLVPVAGEDEPHTGFAVGEVWVAPDFDALSHRSWWRASSGEAPAETRVLLRTVPHLDRSSVDLPMIEQGQRSVSTDSSSSAYGVQLRVVGR